MSKSYLCRLNTSYLFVIICRIYIFAASHVAKAAIGVNHINILAMNEMFFPPKEKFINPYTDTGFKMIFGSEINKDMIIKFLNSLLDETITDITFRNVEALGLNRNDRKAVFDIFCKTDKEEMIIVEMQKSSQKYFSDRVLYYAGCQGG